MRRLFQHIAPLKLLVLLLLVNPFNAYPQQIVLERVSIEPTDSLRIVFSIEGEYSGIEQLFIRFYPDLTNEGNNIDFPLDINNGFDQVIYFPAAASHTGQLHFRLFVVFDMGASSSRIHSAIFLESINSLSEGCDFAIEARWSNYAIYPSFGNVIQAPPIFNEVQVWMYDYDEENSTCIIDDGHPIYTIPQQPLGDSEEMIDLASINNISGGGRYCFRVRSFHNETDIESFSNILKDIELEELVRPEKVEIRSVDVIDNQAIEISVAVDNYGFSFFEYTLQRTDDFNGSFESIQSIKHGADEIIFFDDDVPDFENNPWYYRVVADMERCPMQDPPTSDIASSIMLKPNVIFTPGQANLVEIEFEWKHFDMDGGFQYTLVKELFDQETVVYQSDQDHDTYSETLNLDQLGTDVKYYVQASRASVRIHSNYFLFSPEWLKPPPNAFRPGSSIEVNQKFTPEFYFPAGITGYSLSIYDRNGLRVFQTPPNVDPGEGWNGNIQSTDEPAPPGAYVYVIEFNQAEKPVRGVVYLVR